MIKSLDNSTNPESATLILPSAQSKTEQYHNPHIISTAERIPSSAGSAPHSLPSVVPFKGSSNIPPNSTLELSPVSRAISNHMSQSSVQTPEPTPLDSVPSQFNPPPGSRLLAFARPPAAATKPQPVANNANVSLNGKPQIMTECFMILANER